MIASRKLVAGILAATALALPGAVQAQRTQSGSLNGVNWEAQSRIVGQTSTATLAAGGNPIYGATDARYSGVAALIMNFGAAGSFICTGSLLPDRRSIVTAAHCVTNGTTKLSKPVSVTAYFYDGPNQDVVLNNSGGLATAVAAESVFVNGDYTGEVIDQNDIAVIRLADLAPQFAASYELYAGNDLKGEQFNIAGVGGRSTIGGAFGVDAGTGRRRQGENIFDYRWGDSEFGGFFTDRDANGENFFGLAEVEYSYLSDFDNGLAANDMSCNIAAAVGASAGFGCNTGVGALEVGVAGGDSGGPQFINGQIAGVTSYGLTFGTGFGDFRAGLNSSFGEYSGYVPTYIHRDFVSRTQIVPEPATWAMMIMGFGLAGGALRSRRSAKPAMA